MARGFYPFGQLQRDGTDYDNPNLDEVRNAIPVYRIYRPVRRAEVVSSSEPTQAVLTPWIDFDGTSTGKVDFTANPAEFSAGVKPEVDATVIVRFRTNTTQQALIAGAGIDEIVGGAPTGFGWALGLTGVAGEVKSVIGGGSSASPSNLEVQTVTPPGGYDDGEFHILACNVAVTDSETVHKITTQVGIDGFFSNGISRNVFDSFDETDWDALAMRWGRGTAAADTFDGDVERVVIVHPGVDLRNWDDEVVPFMNNPYDGLSSGGFNDGHIWLIRENTGTNIEDFASSGPLDGTLDTGATWAGVNFEDSGASGITGGFAHFYTRTRELLDRGPNADIAKGSWDNFGVRHPEFPDDFFRHIRSQKPDDSRGVFFSVTNPLQDSGSSTYETSLVGFPDPLVDTDHTASYRYKFNGPVDQGDSPTFELRAALMDGTTEITELNNHVEQQATEEWTHVNVDLPTADVANIGNYADLRMRFDATLTNVPRQNGDPESDLANHDQWERENGDITGLWQSINDFGGASPEDTFARSPGIKPGGTSRFRFGLTDIDNPMTDEGFNVVVRSDTDESGMDMVVQLLENGTQRAIQTFTDIPTTPTTHSFIPDSENIRRITDYDNLQMQVAFKAHGDPGSSPGTAKVGLVPTAFDGPRVNTVGSVTDLQADDNATVDTGAGGDGGRFRVFLESGDDPDTDQDHRIKLRAHRTGGQAGVSVQLFSGGVIIFDSRDEDGLSGRSLPTSESDVAFDLPVSAVQQITSYQNLKVQVLTHAGQAGGTGHYDLLAFEYPGAAPTDDGGTGRRGTVYWAVLGTPSKYWVGVSWARMFAPDPNGAEEGDRTELYAGDYTSLYNVDDSPWSTVSKSGGYSLNDIPRSWAFCGFGDNLVATNKVDPVQVKIPADTLFKDLITSTQQPQAAACAVVRRHLILGNIEYTSQGAGDPNGQPDEWWCSGLDDPADFDISVTTGSNRGRTQGTPGEIVGMTGGDFALLFKRNSVQRLDYVGSPGTFKESVVTSTDGTEFPRSIIQFGRDAYFLDTDGFKVVRQGQYVERIGDGAVNRMVTDTAFEPRAVQPVDSDAVPEKESAVIGAHDSVTDTLWWAVRTRGITGDDPAPVWQNNVLFIYNPTEDRWSVIELTTEDNLSPLRITHLYSLPTTEEASDSVARGVGLITLSGSFPLDYQFNFERFLGQSTYPSTLITKIWSSKLISQDIEKLKINAIRPSYRMAPEATARPNVVVKAEASEDPLMQLEVNPEERELSDANSSLWYPFLLHGEYFRFTVRIPSLVNETVRELNGIGIEHEDAGRKP